MDANKSNSIKKQRNPKNQRDRRKTQDRDSETQNQYTPEVQNNTSEPQPQPQRATRRQRNEPTSIAPSAPSPVVQEKKEPTENVVVDFSNLKRETEEIAKLTKKFTKREVTSNWHRYSAPESIQDTEQTDEDTPAADFSDLLEVPVSRGGHLQLKDEQDWSTASGSELSGYFALDLKLLNQSLLCIPTHDRLRLPKHMFTDQDIKSFNALADHAKNVYSSDNVNGPNDKVLKTLTTLLIHSENNDVDKHSLNVDKPKTEETFNILDVEKSNQKLLNIFAEPEVYFNKESSPNLDTYANIDTNLLKKEDEISKKEITTNKQQITLLSENEDTNKSTDNFSKSENINNLIKRPAETIPIKKESVNILESLSVNEIKLEKSNGKSNNELLLEKPITPSEDNIHKTENLSKENGVQPNVVEEKVIVKEPKEKRERRNIDRKSPGKEMNSIKPLEIAKDVKPSLNDDDDDDLDFLLSLKKPVSSQKKKESKPTVIKDSSFLPGKVNEFQPTNQKQPSELDDWLDSVLED